MPTIGDTSEKARANADRSVKSRTGVWDRSGATAWSGAISAMPVSFLAAVACGERDPVGRIGQDRLRAGPRSQVEAGDLAGDVADGGDPQSGQLGHPLDQPLDRPGAGRSA